MKSSVFIAPYHFSRLWTKIETNISDILFNFSGMGIIEGEKFLQKFGKIYCTVQPRSRLLFSSSHPGNSIVRSVRFRRREISLLDRAVRPDTSAAIFSIGKYFNESNVVPRDYICPPDRPCIGFPGNYEKYQLNIKAWVRVIR